MKITYKNKKLTEAEVNPLDVNGVDITIDSQYKQAILRAIASETAATVEYDQILALEPNVSEKKLVELFHDTLVDLRDEELKHLGQLTTKISEVPEMKDAYDAGVKEAESGEEQHVDTESEKTEEEKDVKESVDPNRKYHKEFTIDAIVHSLSLDDEDYEMLENDFAPFSDIMTAEEVDAALATIANKYHLNDQSIAIAEQEILKIKDPEVSAREDQQSQIADDLYALKNIFDDLQTDLAREAIDKLIVQLETAKLSMNGE